MERRRLLEIPSEYLLLDYIQSTGKQVIDTGVVYDVDDLEVSGTFYLPSDVTQDVRYPYMCGISQRTLINGSYVGRACALGLSPDVSPMALIFSNKTNSDSGNSYGTFNLNTDVSFKGTLKNRYTTLYINGSQVGNIVNYALNWSTCTHSIPLFNAWNNQYQSYVSGQGAKFRVKNWQFKKSGVLVRDYIPVLRRSDWKAGLYDMVNGIYYTDLLGVEDFLYA